MCVLQCLMKKLWKKTSLFWGDQPPQSFSLAAPQAPGMGLPSLRSTVAYLKCGILGPDALARGCIYICVCACMLSCFSYVALVMSDSLQHHGLQLTRLLCPWGFSRQEYWSGLPFPPPGDLPDAGIEPVSLMSPALAGSFFTTNATWEAPYVPYSAVYNLKNHIILCALVNLTLLITQ